MPARAIAVDVVLNLCLLFFVGNTLAVLVAGNLGYMLAHLFALTGFLLLRRDRPLWPRPIRLSRAWLGVAAALAMVNAVVIAVGATSPGLTGYGGLKEVLIGLGVLGCHSSCCAFAASSRTGNACHCGRRHPPCLCRQRDSRVLGDDRPLPVVPARMRTSTHRIDNMPMDTSVLIVDDHAQFRRNARRLLERGGYQVVGEAGDGHTGIAEADRLNPEVVLLDVYLPDIDGFDVAERLTSHGAAVVILTSSRDGRDFGPLVTRCGAKGFIAKTDLSGASLGALLDGGHNGLDGLDG